MKFTKEDLQLNTKIRNLLDKICEYRYTTEWAHLNFKLIPVTVIPAKVGNEKIWNELAILLKNSKFTKIVRTKSGGISIARTTRLYNHYIYDIKKHGAVFEITVSMPFEDHINRTYRIQFRNNNYHEEGKEKLVSGSSAMKLFYQLCKKYHIDWNDYAVSYEEGKKINETIHKPDVRLFNPLWGNCNRVWEDNVYQLDFHKAYFGGLVLSHPEFKPLVDDLLSRCKGKNKDYYKITMAAIIGSLHSEAFYYRYAGLARDAINTFYKRFDEVLELLSKERTVILTRTDGIWYVGPEWHGKYESEDLGGWSNSHKNCKFSAMSRGSYQFMENGVYYPKVCGKTTLDEIKPRSEWQWDDIKRSDARALGYYMNKEGIIKWHEE